MTYRKGSCPDLSMICMSVFFFFSLGFCYNWWKSIRGCFPITPYCTVAPAVWASPSESSDGAPRFSGLGVQTQRSLSLSVLRPVSLALFLSCSLEHKVPWEGSLCSTLVARCPPQNNTCTTDECGERERWVGLCNITVCTPRPPQSNTGPPGQIPTPRWQRLKVFGLQSRWNYWKAIYHLS